MNDEPFVSQMESLLLLQGFALIFERRVYELYPRLLACFHMPEWLIGYSARLIPIVTNKKTDFHNTKKS